MLKTPPTKRRSDQAIEDYDNAVRLCPNYETDFMDRNFAYGGKYAVDRARELLDSRLQQGFGTRLTRLSRTTTGTNTRLNDAIDAIVSGFPIIGDWLGRQKTGKLSTKGWWLASIVKVLPISTT